MELHPYYVYELRVSGDKSPFYVGKGSKDRMYHHERAVRNGRIPNKNPHLANKIKKALAGSGIEYRKVFESSNELECLSYERALISKYGLANLCNIAPGGNQPPSTKGKPGPNRGKKLSAEHRRRLSEAGKRRVTSEATKRKLSLAGRGRVVSVETREKISSGRRGPANPLARKDLWDSIDQIREDKKSGMSWRAVGRKYGTSHQVIQRMLSYV